jgi:putative solute:sodium symporter small subunit
LGHIAGHVAVHHRRQDAGLAAIRLQQYWLRVIRLTAWLLLWALVSFGLTYFARHLNFSFFGWPFSFWLASQGALLVFCLIVAFYAYAMRKLDEQDQAPDKR